MRNIDKPGFVACDYPVKAWHDKGNAKSARCERRGNTPSANGNLRCKQHAAKEAAASASSPLGGWTNETFEAQTLRVSSIRPRGGR